MLEIVTRDKRKSYELYLTFLTMVEWKRMNQTRLLHRRGSIWCCILLWSAVVIRPVSSWITSKKEHHANNATLHHLRGNVVNVIDRRQLQDVDSNCNAIRSREDYYSAELQLYYMYTVEFQSNAKSRSLTGLEALITSSVMEVFVDECDLLDRPLYQVKTNMRHKFSKEEFCAPTIDGNTCSVVNGATAILLDNRSASIQDDVYDAIANGLANSDLVRRFSPSVVRSEFLKPLDESWIAASSANGDQNGSTPPGPITVTVAVAAASVSFIVASIFCYGLMRREMQKHPEPSIRHKYRRHRTTIVNHPSMRLGASQLRQKHRQFVRLDEMVSGAVAGYPYDIEKYPMDDVEDFDDDDDDIENGNGWLQNYTPSITWSVSDITSDSASLRSGVSWTTSRLERIDEADEEEDDFEEMEGRLPNRKRKRLAFKPKSRTPPTSPPSDSRSRPSIEVVGMDMVDAAYSLGSSSKEDDVAKELAGYPYVQDDNDVEERIRCVTPETLVERFSPTSAVSSVMADEEEDDDYENNNELHVSGEENEEIVSVVDETLSLQRDPPGSHSDESVTSLVSQPSDDHRDTEMANDPARAPEVSDQDVAMKDTATVCRRAKANNPPSFQEQVAAILAAVDAMASEQDAAAAQHEAVSTSVGATATSLATGTMAAPSEDVLDGDDTTKSFESCRQEQKVDDMQSPSNGGDDPQSNQEFFTPCQDVESKSDDGVDQHDTGTESPETANPYYDDDDDVDDDDKASTTKCSIEASCCTS